MINRFKTESYLTIGRNRVTRGLMQYSFQDQEHLEHRKKIHLNQITLNKLIAI